jgi:hypothetical protein
VKSRLFGRLAIASLFAALACGSDSTSPDGGSVAGAYTLRTVNGANLPFTILQFGSDRTEIISETVVLTEAGRFTQTGTLRVTTSGIANTVPYSDAGSYTLNGTAGTFTFDSDGSSGTGTIVDGTITVAYAGNSFVYRK